MSDLKFIQAKETDLNLMIEIQKDDGFLHSYYLTSTRLSRLFRRGELFYLVYRSGNPVGFCSLDCEIRCQIHFFSIIQKYTHQGIGSEMLKFMLLEVKKNGYQEVHVFVEQSSPVENFLVKRGFLKVGFYKDRYGASKNANIYNYKF